MTPLIEHSDGSLLWMRSSKAFGIRVPLDILSQDQRASLDHYLRQDEHVLDCSNRSRLIWEYHFSPDQTLLVDVIQLTKDQKRLLDPPKPKLKPVHTYSNTDFVALREQLCNNKTHWQEVLRILHSVSGRAWGTQAWRAKRDKLIGITCHSCGTSSGPMVLQHTRQPRKPDTILKDFESRYREEIASWLDAKPIALDVSQHPKSADACPICLSQVVRYRKTLMTWICLGVDNGVRCGHVFAEPVKEVSKWTIRELEKQETKSRKLEFFEEKGIGQSIALEALDDIIRYLNMDNVITLCKRCAFVADKTSLVLCQVCGSKYHHKNYDCCRDCAPKAE